MNYKNKSLIITIIVLVLIFALSYWYFSSKKTSQKGPMTDEQRLEIISATSDMPVKNISDVERQEIINKTNPEIKPAYNLTDEERMQIINKTN